MSGRTLEPHGMQLIGQILEPARKADGISERRLRHGVACARLPAIVEIDVLVAEVEQASGFDCSGGVENERFVDGCLDEGEAREHYERPGGCQQQKFEDR